MSRTPVLTAMLWTSVGVAGCGDPPAAIVDARIIDGATADAGADAAVDGPVDAPGVMLTFPTSLTMTAECGGATTSADLMIRNDGATAVMITNVTATGGFQVFLEGPITLAPADSVSLSVVPPAAIIGTDLGGATVTGTLTITTDGPGAVPTVALTSTVIGANLALTDLSGATITSVALGGTSVCPAPGGIAVRNSGNAPAAIGFSPTSGSLFVTSGFSSAATVEPGASITHDLRVQTFGPCTTTENLTYTVTGLVCTTTPLVLAASFSILGSSSCVCS